MKSSLRLQWVTIENQSECENNTYYIVMDKFIAGIILIQNSPSTLSDHRTKQFFFLHLRAKVN